MKFVRLPEYLLLLGRKNEVSAAIRAELKKCESSLADKFSHIESRKELKNIIAAKRFITRLYC